MTPPPHRARPVAALLAAGTTYSFEFFPPRDAVAEAQLASTLTELEHTLNRSTATREIWAALGLPMAAAA